MRLAVFGASGRTGRLVVEQAAARSDAVLAIVRSEPDPELRSVARTQIPDLLDRADVGSALTGADAIVWAIGPVADVTTRDVSDAMLTAVEAMRDAGVHRIVATANGSVLTDAEVTGRYANVAAEHRRNLATLRSSGLAWTVVAAPYLRDDPPNGRVETAVDTKVAGRFLTRADLARCLIDAVAQPEWIGHVVSVANG